MNKKWFHPGSEGVLRDVGLLVLRLGFGLTMAMSHGWGKMGRLLSGSTRFADPLGVGSGVTLVFAAMSELVFALLLAVGLLGRLSTVPLIITMGVAFFVHHAGDAFGEKELALVYLLAFVTLLLTGPGRYSIDALIRGRKRSR